MPYYSKPIKLQDSLISNISKKMEDHFDFCHLDGPLCPSMPKFAQKSFEEYLSSNDPRLKKFKKRISLEAGALESFLYSAFRTIKKFDQQYCLKEPMDHFHIRRSGRV